MLYAILGYASEDDVCARTREEDDAVAASLGTLFGRLTEERRLGPVAQLLPTTAATTIRKGLELAVIDGPCEPTREQLLGFCVVECSSLDEAIELAKELARASTSTGTFELRPIGSSNIGNGAAEWTSLGSTPH
jgi:hypothetical protein